MSKHDRKKHFVDTKVQGGLLLRASVYWLFWMLTIIAMLLCWRIVTGPTRMFHVHLADIWFRYAPVIVASILLLPVMWVDLARMSNRFAGPIVRLRRAMQALARGEEVQPIHFRQKDYWRELAEDFNAVAARVQSACDPSDELQTPTASSTSEAVVAS